MITHSRKFVLIMSCRIFFFSSYRRLLLSHCHLFCVCNIAFDVCLFFKSQVLSAAPRGDRSSQTPKAQEHRPVRGLHQWERLHKDLHGAGAWRWDLSLLLCSCKEGGKMKDKSGIQTRDMQNRMLTEQLVQHSPSVENLYRFSFIFTWRKIHFTEKKICLHHVAGWNKLLQFLKGQLITKKLL